MDELFAVAVLLLLWWVVLMIMCVFTCRLHNCRLLNLRSLSFLHIFPVVLGFIVINKSFCYNLFIYISLHTF